MPSEASASGSNVFWETEVCWRLGISRWRLKMTPFAKEHRFWVVGHHHFSAWLTFRGLQSQPCFLLRGLRPWQMATWWLNLWKIDICQGRFWRSLKTRMFFNTSDDDYLLRICGTFPASRTLYHHNPGIDPSFPTPKLSSRSEVGNISLLLSWFTCDLFLSGLLVPGVHGVDLMVALGTHFSLVFTLPQIGVMIRLDEGILQLYSLVETLVW